jgi:hypothetical protein
MVRSHRFFVCALQAIKYAAKIGSFGRLRNPLVARGCTTIAETRGGYLRSFVVMSDDAHDLLFERALAAITQAKALGGERWALSALHTAYGPKGSSRKLHGTECSQGARTGWIITGCSVDDTDRTMREGFGVKPSCGLGILINRVLRHRMSL